MIFDTWGGSLSDAAYRGYSLAYMGADRVHVSFREREGMRVPVIVFTKGGGAHRWRRSPGTGCDVVGLDWTDRYRIRSGAHRRAEPLFRGISTRRFSLLPPATDRA